jgi:hypothetical protein
MTLAAQRRIGLLCATQLGCMRIVTGLTISFDGWLMADPFAPEAVNIVAPQAELRLLL